MLTVLPFHSGDKQQAEQQAEWIATLGSVKSHEIMLVLHASVDPAGVIEPLQRAFGRVFILRVNDKDPKSWPQAPNLMFRRAARQIEATSPQPWLWLEPDAIPLVPHWLDEIEAAYKRCDPKRPFMGVRVEMPNVLPHMSGVAVYPGNAPTLAPLLVTCNHVAFDVNGQSEVLPRLTPTHLIQHEWKPATFATQQDLERLREGAVIYHQCKDGSLIERLRGGRTPVLLEVDRSALADIPTETEPVGRVNVNGNTATLTFDSDEEACQHFVGQLKRLNDAGQSRMVNMYLAAAGLIPPAAPVKAKPGRKPKATTVAE